MSAYFIAGNNFFSFYYFSFLKSGFKKGYYNNLIRSKMSFSISKLLTETIIGALFFLFLYISFLTLWIRLNYISNHNGKKAMILLGSGGHTGEMIRLLESVDMSKFSHRVWVATSGDSRSFSKAQLYEQSLKQSDKSYSFQEIPRARKVGQSWLTTIISSMLCLNSCFHLMIRECPDLVCQIS